MHIHSYEKSNQQTTGNMHVARETHEMLTNAFDAQCFFNNYSCLRNAIIFNRSKKL